MKRLILFLFPVIFLSACSDFYHLQYKKLDKVPARGFVAAPEIKRRKTSLQKKIPLNNSLIFKKDSVVQEKSSSEISLIQKKVKQNSSVVIKYKKKPKEIIAGKSKSIQTGKMHRKRFSGRGLRIVLLFFATLLLMAIGELIFVSAFYAGLGLLAVFGMVVFCFGLVPFYALLAMVLRFIYLKLTGSRPTKIQFEER